MTSFDSAALRSGCDEVRFARKPVVSVIVPARGQVALTARCIESIKRYTDLDYELILVSNGSSEAEEREFGQLVDGIRGALVRLEGKIGYPAAINAGVRHADGEYICLMNNDAAFTGPWAKRLIGDLLDVEVVSPVVDRIGQPCQRLGTAAGTRCRVEMLFFVCVAMRRALFVRMGGLDERFGLGNSEDVQFCEDLKARGGRLMVDPGVFVTHQGSATFLAVLGAEGYRKLLEENRVRREYGEQS